jgi:hypothetical protein
MSDLPVPPDTREESIYEIERDRYGLMYSGPLEVGECVRVVPVSREGGKEMRPIDLAVPGLDQEMPARRHPSREQAFLRVKDWLERTGNSSGDEAVTNSLASEIVGMVLNE